MITQENIQSNTNNFTSITLPAGKLIDVNKCQPIHNAKHLDFQKLYESIASVKNIKAAIEIVDYCINNLPKTKENMIFKQKIMAELFNSYEYIAKVR